MTNTEHLIPAPSTVADDTSTSRPSRVRRLAAALVIAVTGIAGGAMATAAPAEAAADAAVYFCAPANSPVYLYQWTSAGWSYSGRSGNSGSTGCTRFYRVESGVHYAVRAYKVVGTGSACLTNPWGYYGLDGWTSFDYAASGRTANVGTAKFTQSYRFCG